MEILNMRKLVALDIALHGKKFILLEFGIGIPLLLLIGINALLWSQLLGGT